MRLFWERQRLTRGAFCTASRRTGHETRDGREADEPRPYNRVLIPSIPPADHWALAQPCPSCRTMSDAAWMGSRLADKCHPQRCILVCPDGQGPGRTPPSSCISSLSRLVLTARRQTTVRWQAWLRICDSHTLCARTRRYLGIWRWQSLHCPTWASVPTSSTQNTASARSNHLPGHFRRHPLCHSWARYMNIHHICGDNMIQRIALRPT